MDKNQIDIDISSREKIIHNIDKNYFVEAGAGSGKTTVLVKRMVAMIEQGKDISKICAITFTKAAANEFYMRLQEALSLRANAKTEENFKYNPIELDNPNDTTRARCKKALQDIDLAFMGTIDAFCMMILKEHPGAINIPYKTTVIDKKELEKILIHEFKNIELGLYGEELAKKVLIFNKYHRKPEAAFSAIYQAINNNRSYDYEYGKYFSDDLSSRYKSQIYYFKKFFAYLKANPNQILENTKEALEAKEKFDKNYYILSGDYNLPWLILNAYKDLLKIRIAPDSESIELFADLLIANGKKKISHYSLNEVFKNFYDEIKLNQYNISLSFVQEIMPKIIKKNKDNGNLSFYDNLIYLKDALYKDIQNSGKLIKHLYERHSYFLIDEFQDTDPLQAQIFFYLASDIKDKDYTKCIPHPGSLFIVGDPKQSIYRFKNADVAQFLKIRSLFKGNTGEVLYLYQNFRSVSSLKHYFNRTFNNLLPQDTFEQAKYSEIPIPFEDTEGFSGVHYYDADKDDSKIIQNIIEKLHQNEKYLIYDKKKKILRKLEYADFMIITPTKTKLLNYTQTLKEANIPFYVEGKFDFIDSHALVNLIAFYKAIISLDNRYFYALLKSDYYNLSEKTILENDSKIEEIRTFITTMRNKCLYEKPSYILNLLLEELDLFKKCGDENIEYLYFLIEQVISLEENKKILNHYDALTYFEEILEENTAERYPDLSYSADKVHLANLHKVKGLEAAVVILASPGPKKNTPERRIENNKTYLLQVKDEKNNGIVIKNEMFNDIAEAEKISLKEEEKRLVYVAATRARNVLICSSKMLKDGPSSSNIWYPLIKEGPLNILNTLKDSSLSVNSYQILNEEDVKYNSLIYNSEANIAKTKIILPSKLDEYNNESQISNSDNALLRGSIVHRFLELIVENNFIEPIEKIIPAVLKEYDVSSNMYYQNLLTRIADKMFNGGYSQKEHEADLFNILKKADEKYTETKFALNIDNTITLGVIDLIYKYQSKWYIVDYKTNYDNDSLEEHYTKQLKAYKDAFKLSQGEEAETYIYHIEI